MMRVGGEASMGPVGEEQPLWRPSEERKRASRLTEYMKWLEAKKGLRFGDYHALWNWSVTEIEAFWESVWEYFEVRASAPYGQVLEERRMPGAKWFTGARLNFAEHAFRHASRDRPALVFRSELAPLAEVSWAELERRVTAVAASLRAIGVGPGDRVVAYLPNIPQTVVAFLACASVGAIWSSCAPDMGAAAVLDRFRQIEPKVLFAVDGYRYGGKDFDRSGVVAELQRALPTLERLVLVRYLDPHADPGRFRDAVLWESLLARDASPRFEQVPFDHPLWIVYSSGTSGIPKALVHGHGGVLLQMLKSLALEFDVRPADRFFWFSSTSWIIWNLTIGVLLLGGTILILDGNPGWPDPGTLWRFAADAKATFLGTSPAFIGVCMKAGTEPAKIADLSRVRTLGATGSPLSVAAAEWVYERVGRDLLLAAGSGGTDPAAGFVGPCSLLPLYRGEMQCRLLGVAAYAFDDNGNAVTDEVGELVITEPMPSMPLYFWNDPGNRRYLESYFEMYPGKWRHGDWIRITPRGGAVIYGRSDATINRHGIRMGTAELYRAIEDVDEVLDSLVVDLEVLGRESYMPLFVVLREGVALTEALKARINDKIRAAASARYVPNDIFAVAEVPRTLTGKKMELPVKKLLLGRPLAEVASPDAMANPHSLRYFVEFAARLNAR
jgi:acetoacetyl-CoA synthetase